MNKKVVKGMIVLVVAFLLGLYVLKIFFPEQFVMAVQSDALVKIGNYIDTHQWAYYIFGICTSFLTYWLYFGAVFKKWCLNWYQVLIVLAIIGGSIGISFYDTTLSSTFTLLCMLVIPLIFKADMRYCVVVFSVHYLAQSLTLLIRNLPKYIAYYNSLTFFLLALEMYFWLLLFYFYPHIKKEGNNNGLASTTTIRQ
jgi:hypothetical protein